MTDLPQLPDPVLDPDPQRRAIRLEIEVPGTPEEVWAAIATGPGISSWYVPHTVEERTGGTATASFGPGPEMQIEGRVHAWEPPHRIVFGGERLEDGLAFEWLVEAREGGTCVVRLVNSGFGDGQPWDDQYDDMVGGWRLFLRNLWLHRTFFPGREAVAALPMASWPVAGEEAWSRLAAGAGLPLRSSPGERVAASGAGVPPLAGTVVETGPTTLTLLLDEPAPGTAFVAAEGQAVSVWAYLYGDDAAQRAAAHQESWQTWLASMAD